jgi:hypothetical protein
MPRSLPPVVLLSLSLAACTASPPTAPVDVVPVPVPGGPQPVPVPGGSLPRPRPSPTGEPSPTPSPSPSATPTPRPPDLQVSNLTVASGRTWQVLGNLQIGDRAFVDRAFSIRDLDDATAGRTWIRTDTRDAFATADPLARFDVNRRVRVYVAWDLDWPAPDWLESWTVSGARFSIANETVTTVDDYRLLFFRDFGAGRVELGPARPREEASGRAPEMYIVIVDPQ